MRKLLLASVSALAVAAAGAASAADFGPPITKAPPAAFSWTGCYAGAQVGWGWGRSTFTDHSYSNVHYTNSLGGSGYLQYTKHAHNTGPGLIDTSNSRRSASVDQSGGLFGGQLGCDYQFTNNPTGPNFVIGVSGSAAGASINGTAADPNSRNLDLLFPGDGFIDLDKAASVGHSSGLLTADTDFLADISGRLGIAWGQTLFYGKGGVAWEHTRYIADTFGGGTVGTPNNGNNSFDYFGVAGANTSAFTASNTASGAVVGVGIEWAFLANWTVFAEYNHYFFGTKTLDFTATGTNYNIVTANSYRANYNALVDVGQSIDTVKVGVNYRFNFWR